MKPLRFAPESTGAEGEHPFNNPGHGHEAPLAAHLVEHAERELTESERRFDDADTGSRVCLHTA